ncbi:ComF family protein [Patescibacteria group bacterium]
MCEKRSVSGLTHARCSSPWGMDGLVSGFYYSGLIKKLISTYKYKYAKDLMSPLFELLVSYGSLEFVCDKNPFTVTHVPLHKSRENKRGFNQAKLLADAFADYFNWKHMCLLVRKKNTIPQASLNGKERRKGMNGAFRMVGEINTNEKSILLIDDVWTTGTTMRECAKVLKRSGAKEVWGLVLAS